jgi:protein gp37/ParB-like chromosome segregation protein Spo0J
MQTNGVILVKRVDIKTHPDLALFPVGESERKAVAASMRAHGFDSAQPLVRWRETGYLVDGHTRLAAAEDAALADVLVLDRSFEDWDAAIDYAIARQRDRRNLTRQQMNAYTAHVVRTADRLKTHGAGARKLIAAGAAISGKSADELGAKIGVSGDTVERVRKVLASDDEETKAKLLAGKIAPNAAYQRVKRVEAAKVDSTDASPLPDRQEMHAYVAQVVRAADQHQPQPAPQSTPPQPASPPTTLFGPAPKPLPASYSLADWAEMDKDARAEAIHIGSSITASLNKQDTDNIEWAKWSWNPITGCLHNCSYCYARDIANRFFAQKFAPAFLPQRLGAPAHQTVPDQAKTELGYRNIFTCSMADLFGKWVPAEWIEAVLDVVRENPQWNFLLLTKFPNRLAEFTYPKNAWLGTSVDCQARVKNAERSFAKVQGGVKWLSIEPMLEPLKFDSLAMFDWVVIGGASKSTETPEWIPPRRWVMDLERQAVDAGCMIYEKTNLGFQNSPSRLREYPGWERPEAPLPSSLKYLPSIG